MFSATLSRVFCTIIILLRAASDGNQISDQSSELRYSGFEPCKESTMLSQSQRPDIRRIKSKSKVKVPSKTIQPNTETSEEEPDLRQKRHCLLDSTYLMNVTNRKQLDPPNKTLQLRRVDLFEDIDRELRKSAINTSIIIYSYVSYKATNSFLVCRCNSTPKATPGKSGGRADERTASSGDGRTPVAKDLRGNAEQNYRNENQGWRFGETSECKRNGTGDGGRHVV